MHKHKMCACKVCVKALFLCFSFMCSLHVPCHCCLVICRGDPLELSSLFLHCNTTVKEGHTHIAQVCSTASPKIYCTSSSSSSRIPSGLSKALANTGKHLLFYKYKSHFLSSMLANNCLEHGPQLQCFCVPPVSSELLFCGDRQSMYVFALCSTVTELRHLCLLAGTFHQGHPQDHVSLLMCGGYMLH